MPMFKITNEKWKQEKSEERMNEKKSSRRKDNKE
jgi:hypothetical protein